MFARLLRTGHRSLWLVLGLVVGVGLETKHTMVALLAAIFLGVLISNRRSMLLSPVP